LEEHILMLIKEQKYQFRALSIVFKNHVTVNPGSR